MTTWVNQVHAKASILHDQIMAAKEMQRLSGVDTSLVADNYRELLERLYTENLPLANLLDTSDILLHAEGPATSGHTPSLHAFNWLCQTAEKQMRLLAKTTFDLSEGDARRLANKVDLRLTGMAPGSIYAGFKIQHTETAPLIEGSDEAIFKIIKETITQLPIIPEFIGDEVISGHINDVIPDSAIRDAMLMATMNLAPTGQLGIHTVELSSPSTHKPSAGLSQRERVVIREALKKPTLNNQKQGSFVGEIREIDLDAKRFHLRGINGVGTLRCILPEHYRENDSKTILGDMANVSGQYECNADGRPRLLIVSDIEKNHTPKAS